MHQKPDDPISAEIKRLEKPLGGRRTLSWLLFLLGVVVALVLPVAGSEHGAELRTFIEKLPLIGSFIAPRVASTETALLARRHDPSINNPATRKSHDDTAASSTDSPPIPAMPTVLALDRVWNPGPLADAHKPWANDCKVCHSEPFTQVKDADCLTCHADVGEHVKAATGLKVHGVNDLRCASCHHDHQGQFALTAQNLHFTGRDCAACHSNIKHADPKTTLLDVADFADKHPAFTVDIASPAPESKLTKVRQETGKALEEPTGLKFPHDLKI